MLYQRAHQLASCAAAVAAIWLWWSGSHLLVAVTGCVWLAILIRRRARANALRDAGLRARAEYEHRLNLSGDPRGIYGRYPPASGVVAGAAARAVGVASQDE